MQDFKGKAVHDFILGYLENSSVFQGEIFLAVICILCHVHDHTV